MNKEKILTLIDQATNSFNEIHLLVTEKKFLENQKELLSENQNLAAEAIGALEPIFENNIYNEKELAKAKNIFRKSLTINDMFGSNILLNAVSELKIAHSKVKHHLSDNKPKFSAKNSVDTPPNSVFIVHGHDELAKIETARFIEKLGLEAIILHEKASSGKTIIEKIEEYSNVGFGVVLYTPCDQGSQRDDYDNLKHRARQNVVFEHGYLIGKIGRNNVCALVKGNVEIPNDISGVVYIPFENDWRFDLAKELRNSGYLIDMNLVV
ncbi:Predicted nucleotide-binding protein containing TIR-like domain [Gillisia sp. Hel1_33_143]|uniref:TIR domain-containing protein n=1 Tax=Gillisia sp. Hel1_33_143 TaxID=1336796 RepID=UPI00087BC8CA|nr:nucleotide-binding protein [Gillisia sp. Hel1_33_143]SDR77187.1 Predicted nucleotide-binding protein containing TIR-like domain [Gillisia sp. Hel1_33_143]